jgi:hypothetical protein
VSETATELRRLLKRADKARARFDAAPKAGNRYNAAERDRQFYAWRNAADDLRDALERNAEALITALEAVAR